MIPKDDDTLEAIRLLSRIKYALLFEMGQTGNSAEYEALMTGRNAVESAIEFLWRART